MAALQVPTAEPHYAHRQAISLHELRARMADAITDWLGGRANPLRRPALTSLNWSRQVYLDEYGGDEEGFLWQRVPIRQFDPEELVLLARHGRVRLCSDTSDAPEEDGQTIEEQLLNLAGKGCAAWSCMETTTWLEGTRMTRRCARLSQHGIAAGCIVTPWSLSP